MFAAIMCNLLFVIFCQLGHKAFVEELVLPAAEEEHPNSGTFPGVLGPTN